MDIETAWGLCRACDRWFAVADWAGEFGPQPRCPSCRTKPELIVLRDEPEPEAAELRIEGQCPRCRRWFAADDWYDDTAPVPCCPTCDLVPAKLAYVHGTGKRVERVLTVDVESSEQWLG
jgi:hypothetical protein